MAESTLHTAANASHTNGTSTSIEPGRSTGMGNGGVAHANVRDEQQPGACEL
jgi:hypothetical protein